MAETTWLAPRLLASSMSRVRQFPKTAKDGEPQQPWQYHSRSDDHSKIAAVGVALDLLTESPELRRAAAAGLVGYEVNPVVTDRANRKKTLDLGIGLIDDAKPHHRSRSLVWLLEEYGAVVSEEDRALIASLPDLREAFSKQDLVLLENKACMTAHGKAAPRLRNELEGAADAIYNSDAQTVSGALVLVNAAPTFVSPVFRNNGYVPPEERRASLHNQPEDAIAAVEKLQRIPLRTADVAAHYDALGILVVSAKNDGSPWALCEDGENGAPRSDDIWHYTKFIQQLAKAYRQRIRV